LDGIIVVLRVGWFSTGNGKGSYNLLRYVKEAMGDEIEIPFCVTDRSPGDAEGSDKFFKLLKEYKIQRCTINLSPGSKHLVGIYLDVLETYRPEVCVLGGYMKIIPSEVLGYTKVPMLNLHPALPHGPIGTWKQVEEQLKEEGATESGVMIHLVTKEVDRGPVVSWCQYTFPNIAYVRDMSIIREGPLMTATLNGGFGDLTKAVDNLIIDL